MDFRGMLDEGCTYVRPKSHDPKRREDTPFCSMPPIIRLTTIRPPKPQMNQIKSYSITIPSSPRHKGQEKDLPSHQKIIFTSTISPIFAIDMFYRRTTMVKDRHT
jgi:hypothetical protein